MSETDIDEMGPVDYLVAEDDVVHPAAAMESGSADRDCDLHPNRRPNRGVCSHTMPSDGSSARMG